MKATRLRSAEPSLVRSCRCMKMGLAFSGDAVDAALHKAGYTLRKQIMVKEPVVDIYHRE